MQPRPLLDRLADSFEIAESGCWEWQKSKHAGYGHIKLLRTPNERLGRTVPAHRAMWETVVGPIPEGLTIDHLCQNKACVNPDHLEPVTYRENVLRSPIAPARLNADKTHCMHGHAFTPENTMFRPEGKRRCRTCHNRQVNDFRAARREET